MELFAKYYIREGNKRTYLQPEKMRCIQSEPQSGEVVNINGIKYEVLSANYDYELW